MNRDVNGNRRWLWIGLASASVVGGVFLYREVRYQIFPRRFGVVEAGAVYRSGRLTPRMLRQVCEKYNIRTVIDLADKTGDPECIQEQEVLDELGIPRVPFRLPGDGTGDPEVYAAVVDMLADESLHPVLIHCASGAQRTGTSVVLYRHLVQGRSFTQAYPETFLYDHKPDEWIMMAYLADNDDAIRAKFRELQSDE